MKDKMAQQIICRIPHKTHTFIPYITLAHLLFLNGQVKPKRNLPYLQYTDVEIRMVK